MTAWRFDGTLLPGGRDGEMVVGVGEASDLPGRYAVTGLVDAHCHLSVDVDRDGPFVSDLAFAERRMAELAAVGVTLVRDVGGRSEITLDFARSPRAGLPSVLAAGRFHSTRDRYFPRMYTPCDPDDLDASIRTEIAGGATWVKIIADFPQVTHGMPERGTVAPTYDDETLARAVVTAHAAGARVAAHSTLAASALVAMGVDSIEHGNGLTEDDLVALGARGGGWTPTLGAVMAQLSGGDPEAVGRVEAIREHHRHHLAFAVEAGVTVMTGSDAVSSVAEELGLLVSHGLSVDQAVDAATVSARSFLGVEAASDLVTYDADPREDPAVLASPKAVVIRGERVV